MEKMTEREITERRLIKMAYRKGRKDFAKEVIEELVHARKKSCLDYVGVAVIDSLKNKISKMAGVDDESKA